MTEGERVRYLRKEVLHLTLEKFGERLGVKRNTLSTIENGKGSVTNQMRAAICNAYGVNETWLRTGDGPIIEPVDEEEELYMQVSKLFHYRPESFRRRLFNMLNAMPDELLDRLELYALKYLLTSVSDETKKTDGKPSAFDDTPDKEV